MQIKQAEMISFIRNKNLNKIFEFHFVFIWEFENELLEKVELNSFLCFAY